MNDTKSLHRTNGGRDVVSDLRLWFGVMGGAVAWFLHFVLAYLIAEFGCVNGWGEVHWLGLSAVAWLGWGWGLAL